MKQKNLTLAAKNSQNNNNNRFAEQICGERQKKIARMEYLFMA